MVQKKKRNKSERSSGIYYRPLFFMIDQWDIYLVHFVLDLTVCATLWISQKSLKFEISSNTRNKSVTKATNHTSVSWVGI